MTNILPTEPTDFIEQVITHASGVWRNSLLLLKELKYEWNGTLYTPQQVFLELDKRTPVGAEIIRDVYPHGKSHWTGNIQGATRGRVKIEVPNNGEDMSTREYLSYVAERCPEDAVIPTLGSMKIKKVMMGLAKLLELGDLDAFKKDYSGGSSWLVAGYTLGLNKRIKR